MSKGYTTIAPENDVCVRERGHERESERGERERERETVNEGRARVRGSERK